MRNAGKNLPVLDQEQTYKQVCFGSKLKRSPPEFLIRLASLGTFSPGEGLRLRRSKETFTTPYKNHKNPLDNRVTL